MEGSKIRFVNIVIIVILVLLVGGIWKSVKYKNLKPDSELYQMVFLKNDQAYFGKLHSPFSQYPYLTEVYYLNSTQQVDERGRPSGVVDNFLRKRGIDEIHKPTDKLYFSRENILYWENVGRDSVIAQGIAQAKATGVVK